MAQNINEAAVIFHRKSGHNHDGVNSTKVDFTNYTVDDLRALLDLLNVGVNALPSGGSSSSGSSSGSGVGRDSVVFHMPGAVGLSPANVAQKVILYPTASLNVYATLGVAGSAPTVVTIYKKVADGTASVLGQITIPAGHGVDSPVTASFMASFNGSTEMVYARVTTAGSDAQELAVEIVAVPTGA